MVEVRTYHTDTLSSTTPGRSGAFYIGIPDDIQGAAATELESALRELYARPTGAEQATESVAGISEFSDATEIQNAADTAFYRGLAVSAYRFKQELDRRLAVEALHMVGAVGEPTFQSGWMNYGSDHSFASFYKDRGRVYLEGTVKSGSTGSAATIFTLPAGYRPAASKLFSPAVAGTSTGRVDVFSDGRVVPQSVANTNYLSLEGISFRVA